LFYFGVLGISEKTILKYSNIKKSNNHEKVGERAGRKSGKNFGEKTYSGCGKT
jgi:hypothetical protein